MCLATQIRTEHSEFQCHLGASVAHDLFLDLYRRRLDKSALRIPKAVDEGFRRVLAAHDPIMQAIDAYQTRRTQTLEQALFAERSSMADVNRLAACDSQLEVAEGQHRMATARIRKLLTHIGDTKSSSLKPQDARIYSRDVAPVAIWREGRVVMVPMQYQHYPASASNSYRHRTQLQGAFGVSHGLLLADAFIEHVALPRSDDDDLELGEPAHEVEMRFAPLSAEPMLLACVWWPPSNASELPRFTILLDLPPPEIAHTGHGRCVIPIAPQNSQRWLCPNGKIKEAETILESRVRPYFENTVLT